MTTEAVCSVEKSAVFLGHIAVELKEPSLCGVQIAPCKWAIFRENGCGLFVKLL